MQELKVVAAENDPEEEGADEGGADGEVASRLPQLGKDEEPLGFLALNVAGAGARKSKRTQETPAAKVHGGVRAAREQGRKLRMQVVDALADKTLLPGGQEVKGYDDDDDVVAGAAANVLLTGKVLTAAAKLKKKVEKKHQEEAADNYTLVQEVDHALDKYGGTNVLGWNRSPFHVVKWTHVNLYIVRAHGDCADEVEIILSKVLPRVRAVLLPAAVTVHVRDLGGLDVDELTTLVPPLEERNKLPAITLGLGCLHEVNAMRLVLLGTNYGPSWKATAGDPDPRAELPPGFDDLSEQTSELDILATEACQNSELKHKAFKKRTAAPRTLLYSCVDPEAQIESFGDGTSVGEGSLMARSPGLRPMRGGGSVAAKSRSTANLSKSRVSGMSGAGAAPMLSSNPIVVMKMQKKEEKKKKNALLARLNKLVFNALVRDPESGKPRDPVQVFKLLDQDGSGTLAKEEFRVGLVLCGLEMEEYNLDVLWESLDEDGGGDLDYEELCKKLAQQYNKVLAAEAKHLKNMPRLLSSKLETSMPKKTVRARLDTMKDFQDTSERQKARWHKRFEDDLTADLRRLLPVLAMAAVDIEEERERLLDHDKDTMPLNFQPEVPEYTEHTECVLRHARQANQHKQMESSGPDSFWNKEGAFRLLMGLLEYAKGIVSWPCAVIGERGTGRSHVVREFVLALRRERPMDHIVVHTVGESTDSCELHSMLWHVCLELGKRFDVIEEVMSIDPFTIVDYFPRLLLKLTFESGVMLHVVIDGMDRLTENGKLLDSALDWFPTAVPVQVRMVMSTCEGVTLNAVRRKKARFDGHSEVVEFKMPIHGEENRRRAAGNEDALSSDSDESDGRNYGDDGSSRSGSEPRAQERLTDPAVVHMLMKCDLLQLIEGGTSPDNDVFTVVEDIVSAAEGLVGSGAVRRFFFIIVNSRHGILEQDMYEMLNANTGDDSVELPFLRLSYQQFLMLRDMLAPIVKMINYGGQSMLWFAQSSFEGCVKPLFDFKTFYFDIHTLISQHYMQQVDFISSPSARWHGENRRAVTEVAFHLSQARLSEKVLSVVTNLRYIEARCSLGLNQAAGLILDYKLLLTRSHCAVEWIKTDLIKVQDCFTMIRRYAYTFVKYPRWVFSISASLPDTTGPSMIAKASWSIGNEVRPQLAWLNKPQVSNPCILKVDDRGVVLHCACFSRDMTRMVAGGQDKMVFVWSLPEGTLIAKLPGHADHVMSVQISIDDEHIMSGSRDGAIIFWKMPALHELEERISLAEEAIRLEHERREEEGLEDASEDEEGSQMASSGRPQAGGEGSDKDSAKEGELDDGQEDADKEHEGGSGKGGGGKRSREEGGSWGAPEGGGSRPMSKKSVRIRAPKKERKGSGKYPPIEMPDVLLDTSKLISMIPAHKSTVWSVAFSTVFNYRAKIQLPVGEKRYLGETVPIYEDFHGMYARLGSGIRNKDAFPLSVIGNVITTRAFTEDERKGKRLRANAIKDAKFAAERAAQAQKNEAVDEKDAQSKKVSVAKDKAAKRRASITSDLESWEASQAEDSAKLEEEKLEAELADQGPIPDFEHSLKMADKIVIYSLVGHEGDALEEQEILFAIKSFQECGAAAVVLAGDEDDTPELVTETFGISIPVVTVNRNVMQHMKDDTAIKIYRVLEQGNLCASTSSDRTIKIWDSSKAVSGHALARRPVALLEGHTSYVTHCSFSPYGDMLASSSGDNTVRLWDMKTMKEKFVFQEALAPVMESNWSADGTMVLSASHDGWFRLWKPSDGHTLKASKGPHEGHLWSCAFSEDQRFCATGGHDGRVVIWEIEQMLSRNKEVMVLEGHLGPVFSLHFSPDGTRIVSCSSDRSARVWATDHDLEHYSLHHEQLNLEKKQAEAAHKIEMKELVSKSRSGWSNAGGAQTIWEKQAHPTTIHCISFSPDSRDLVTGAADAEIIIWSVSNESVRKKLLGHMAAVFAMCFSREGSYLASGDSGGEVIIWDPIAGRKLFTFTSHTDRVWSLHFNPQSTRLVTSSSDCTIKLWRLDDPFDNMEKTSGLVIYDDYYEENERQNPNIPSLILPVNDRSTVSQGSSQKVLETSGGGLVMMPGKKGKKVNQPNFKAYDEQRSAILQTISLKRIAYCCKFSKSGLELATASADSLVHLFKFTDDDMEELEEYGLLPRQGMDSPDKHRSYVKHVSDAFLSQKRITRVR